jgi:hypothetical protein
MLNLQKNGLALFDNFIDDLGLPKHRGPPEDEDSEFSSSNSDGSRTRRRIQLRRAFAMSDEDGEEGWPRVVERREVPAPSPPEWWRRLGIAIGVLKADPPHIEEQRMTVLEFFTAVKGGVQNIDLVAERAAGYERALSEAKRAGQTALEERIVDAIEAVRAETHLLDMGITTYVEEAVIVEFVKKAPKGVRLDWLTNFTRQVPVEIIDKKEACDQRHTFDNYAVLHYDPLGTGRALTKQQEEDRKDPILFGIFRGQRKLYPIGDWVDEHCNLTLDEMAVVLGRRPETEIPRAFEVP